MKSEEKTVEEKEAERIERECVEQVFGLTGGELDSGSTVMVDASGDDWTFHYTYDGAPEYARADLDGDESDYFTAVRCCMFGEPAELLVDATGGIWDRVAFYLSSGETECPERRNGPGVQLVGSEDWRDDWMGAEPPADPDRCPLCEAARGEEHGHIYLGDGWAEVVYRRRKLSFSAQHVDTCFVDYLTDHHGRDGELLYGLELGALLTVEEWAAEAMYDLIDRLPEGAHYDEVDLTEAIEEALHGSDLRPRDESGNPTKGDDYPEEQASIWVVVRFSYEQTVEARG